MESALPDAAWERMHAPYDQSTYQAVLDQLGAEDVVLDIGAGDLRLARQMAAISRRVYSVEIDPRLLEQPLAAPAPLPANLIPICADARTLDFPADITAGVLLMRHCTCFSLYAAKLKSAGAKRMITNARWRMDVEVVDLCQQRLSFTELGLGWYACLCGGTGFKDGPVEHWSWELDKVVNEVFSCPQCIKVTRNIMSF